jgi:hypothetical protein
MTALGTTMTTHIANVMIRMFTLVATCVCGPNFEHRQTSPITDRQNCGHPDSRQD